MKKIIAFFLASILNCSIGATAAPADLAATNIDPNNQTALLSWDEDLAVNQWYIYLGGVLTYQPFRNQTGSIPGPRRTYNMTGLPHQNYVVVTMRALAPAQPISAESAALTVTSAPSIIYVLNPPNQAITVTGSFSAATSSVATAVSVIAGVSGISVTAKQGSPWTVSGSVGVTSGVAGISVTASQGSPWTVSGSATVFQGGPWTVSGSVSASITGTSTVSQGSPWTVSGSVSIQSATTGLAVNVSNTINTLTVLNAPTTGQTVNVSNTVNTLTTLNLATTGLAVNISNTPAVTISSATTGLAVNVSNTVNTNTVINSATTGLAVNISNTPAVTISSATTGLAVNISNTPAITCAACATSANQTTQITAEQAIQGAVTQTSGMAMNISQVAGNNLNLVSGTLTGKLPIMVFDGNGRPLTGANGPADGGTNALNPLFTMGWNEFFNGTTWDRARSVTGLAIPLGVQAVGVTGWNGTNSLPVGVQVDSENNTRLAVTLPEYHTRSTTYAVSASPVTPVANASDIFTIVGSATKTVVVKRITISGAATLQGSYTIALVKRTAADSGGTYVTQTAVPLDSNDAAATAAFYSYSANPVTASALATLQTVIQPLGVINGGNTTNAPLILDFSIGNIKAIYLRGTSQVLSINGQQITAPSGAILNINAIVEEY